MIAPLCDRMAFLAFVAAQDGKLCLWEAKGPDVFDCSGLITCGIFAAGGPDLRQTFWTQRIWAELQPTGQPQAGDLVLYGRLGLPGLVGGHVMVWLGDGRVHGACGASSLIRTAALARLKGARVRTHESRDYRRDFLGYRRLPAAA